MTGYMTEQQQIEQLKLWWKKNGTSTVMIFILALAVSIGWHFWLKHREVKLERGSSHYESLLNALVNENNALALKEANLLKSDYQHTPYAALATLVLARSNIYQNNYDAAEKQLTWVMKHGSTNSLREVARLRLARVDIQQQHPQQALDVLTKINDKNYLPLIEEVRGDSYVALQQWDNARQAYQQALSVLPDPNMRPLLRMKLEDLSSTQHATVKAGDQ